MDLQKIEFLTTRMGYTTSSLLTRTVQFSGERGPLGIKVVPYCSSLSGRSLGLHVRGVEENSRSKREGIFQEDECIVQINDSPLMDKSFSQSQEIFRLAMSSPIVNLEVLPVANKLRYEKSLIGLLPIANTGAEASPKSRSPVPLRPTLETPPRFPEAPTAATTFTQRVEPPPRQTPEPPEPTESPPPRATAQGQSESPVLKKGPTLSTLANLANKKGGKKMKIDLKKGTDGLGFTVVTRDSSVHGPGPILVKSILPKGAAVRDGRLQSGDRILEVNGVDITGRTQEELVAMLRSTKLGETVSMVVARPEEMFLPRELKGEQPGGVPCQDSWEQLVLDVPLSDSGSAGLGLSLKGNKSRETGEDLGIFIKSIIHGGAAHKDGRLRVNDQLVVVNEESLLGRSNHDAMETLRRSMSSEGNLRGSIQLVVLRGVEGSPAQEPQENIASQGPTPEPRPKQQHHVQPNTSILPQMVENSIYESAGVSFKHPNGCYVPLEEDYDDDGFPPPPSHLMVEPEASSKPAYVQRSKEPIHHAAQLQTPPRHSDRTSKSMDLVPDESNVGSLTRLKTGPPSPGDLGPTLGLKKSSSLESLQTAMTEVAKPAVPFHRPPTNMVRGRGCNQSFRFAIDKSYDGPSEPEDDDSSDDSSGRDTQASGSSRQEAEDGKKKRKNKKKKEKTSKGRKKEEEPEKRTKKKGFTLLRFGKKNQEEKVKAKGRLDALSEEELDRGRAEGARNEMDSPTPTALPDVEEDDLDPNYARINKFRQAPPTSQSPSMARSSSPRIPPNPASGRDPPEEDPREGLYAKVNKQRVPAAAPADSNAEKLQKIRREFQLMRAAPPYEDMDARRRAQHDYEPQQAAGRGPDQRQAPRYEDTPYARRPLAVDLPSQTWGGLKDPSSNLPIRETFPLRETYSTPEVYPQRQNSPRLPVPRATGPPQYPSRPHRQDSPDQYGAYEDPAATNPLIGAV
ncbi:par-3 family cell polarity regulator beta a isoform X2 [Denticeps clupeoides]|nr:partitioning defective 3 homolog B-like isoform X2 [Denticeps clupeoides]